MNLMEALIQAKLGGGGGGGGSVTPASIVTATGQMTPQQKSDTLGNLGGEPEKLIVNVTHVSSLYSADKTFEEIEAAKNAGKTVVAKLSGNEYQLGIIDSGEEEGYFFNIEPDYFNDDIVTIRTLSVNINDEWVGTEQRYKCDPHTVTDLSSTSITLANAADNTIYECGELTSLTVTAIANPGEFSITFTSGSTATVLTVPNTMIMPDGFAVEASTRYEINVKNGYALAAGWAVGA